MKALTTAPRTNRVLRGRPELYTSYKSDMALLNTRPKRMGVLAIVVAGVIGAFVFTSQTLVLLALCMAAAIGAIGMNLVTGYAGQVSLGHAFFIGIGAYTATALSGDPEGRFLGLGWPFPVALLAAGVVAAIAGLIVSPLATRFRGLYLAIVTLGLVFLGLHIFREWRSLTGGLGTGRPGVVPDIFGWRLDAPTEVLGYTFTASQQRYLLCLVLLVLFAILGRNLARSAVGRAFQAIRDRDIAAEIMGVPLTRYKTIAFGISSFYAGISGALWYTVLTVIEPSRFDLLLSVQYIAMVLIGGIATISGSIMGAFFIVLLPTITREIAPALPLISPQPTLGPGDWLTVFHLEGILYGGLIVAFLLFQPRGFFGFWIKIRNYWKGWPFSY